MKILINALTIIPDNNLKFIPHTHTYTEQFHTQLKRHAKKHRTQHQTKKR